MRKTCKTLVAETKLEVPCKLRSSGKCIDNVGKPKPILFPLYLQNPNQAQHPAFFIKEENGFAFSLTLDCTATRHSLCFR